MFVLCSVNRADMLGFQRQFSNPGTGRASRKASPFLHGCREGNAAVEQQTVGAVPVSIKALMRERVCLLGCKGLGIQ